MTMIAINTNYNVPIIIGDLLITGNIKPDRFILPSTGGNVIEQIDQTASFFPIQLTQKVYILQDNLAIAFSGNGSDIKKFLADIKMFCRYYDNVTQDKLTTWLQEYSFDENSDISIAILLAETVAGETTMSQLLHGNWGESDSALYETTWVTGSGATDFLKEVSIEQEFTTGRAPGDVGYALQSNIILIARLLAQERLSQSTGR